MKSTRGPFTNYVNGKGVGGVSEKFTSVHIGAGGVFSEVHVAFLDQIYSLFLWGSNPLINRF